MSEHALIGFSVRSDRYDSDDDRWRDQVADLLHDLRTQADSLRVTRTPVPGTKGTVDELVLALGSAGAFTATVELFRAWLARDKTRSVDLTYTDGDGQQQQLHVSATHATDAVFAPVLAAVSAKIGAVP